MALPPSLFKFILSRVKQIKADPLARINPNKPDLTTNLACCFHFSLILFKIRVGKEIKISIPLSNTRLLIIFLNSLGFYIIFLISLHPTNI